ncbi:thioredoxin family protein [Flavobacterium sp.]|uniref:thioredoxin family protein n=1 Tax=Flavobacterium sp. TaxID=239 RepID=UPI00334157F5
MNSIITNSISKSCSYNEYRSLISTYAQEGKTTGLISSPDYINYTKLNESRMHRLDKTIEVTQETKALLENLSKEYIWLVISETWCGDAAQVIPVINKMAEVASKIDLRIVLRDENEDLMNLFLTNGTKSIPKLIIIEKETGEVVGDFGPRPTQAKQLIIDYKAAHGVVDETAKIELQKWYLADKGVSIQNEICALIKTTASQNLPE